MKDFSVSVNKYVPFVLLYFFFNSLLLPEGLLYTTFLTPLFLYEIVRGQKLSILFAAILLITAFFILHSFSRINELYYAKSFILFITVIIFSIYFSLFVSKVDNIGRLFKYIIYTNALLLPFAVISLKTGVLKDYFWYMVPFTPDMPVTPRLKMFTYEASYYSLLLVPISFYTIWNFILKMNVRNAFLLMLVLIPLLMSFSLGVMAGIVITLVIVFALSIKMFLKNKRLLMLLVVCVAAFTCLLFILFKYFPETALVTRIRNIPSGKDTSARGRTYEALDLAGLIAKQRSIWFGVGLGQIKEMGRTTIVQYYQYTNIPATVRIPNSVAETFAIYGIIGIVLKFSIIIFMFFKTRVFNNYYRLSLFVFIFIYQFTGSFLFNIAEFVLWILAFSKLLPEFNKKNGIHGSPAH